MYIYIFYSDNVVILYILKHYKSGATDSMIYHTTTFYFTSVYTK